MRKLSTEEYKNRILTIMLKVDKICRENGFRYSIAYGTLLGSVRHQGFIPWDDDMDIIMTRSEYERLKKYIVNHPEYDLNFIDIGVNKDTIYPFGKICDKYTIVKESNFRMVDGYGAFIDVFPMDNIPDEEVKRKRFYAYSLYLARLIQHSAKTKPGIPNNLRHAILLNGAFLYSRFFSTYKLVKKLDQYCRKYNETNTKCFGIPYCVPFFEKTDFDELIDLPFEGYQLVGPKKYEKVLERSYGNYMQIPAPDERVNHSIECYWKE